MPALACSFLSEQNDQLDGLVKTFTYIITDLTEFESEPLDMELETDEEAVMYGAHMARELFRQMPDFMSRGMRVTVYDDEGDPISIVPIDPVH